MTWEEAKDLEAKAKGFKDFEDFFGAMGDNRPEHDYERLYHLIDDAGYRMINHYRQQITITVPAGCVVVVDEVKK